MPSAHLLARRLSHRMLPLVFAAALHGLAAAATYSGIVQQVSPGAAQGPSAGVKASAQPAAGAPTRASVLDPHYYLTTYPDLKAALGANIAQAQQHWLQYGIREGRQPSPHFSLTSYLARYPDLKRAFGNDFSAALDHWVQHGFREGRDASPNGRFLPGALIRARETGATYLVDPMGSKRWIVNPQVFDGCGLSWGMAQDLSRDVVDRVPTGAQLNTAAECRAVLAPPGAGPGPR